MDLFGRFLMLFLILPLRTKEMQPNGSKEFRISKTLHLKYKTTLKGTIDNQERLSKVSQSILEVLSGRAERGARAW